MYIGCGRKELVFPGGFFPTEGFVEQVHPLYVRAMILGEKQPFVLVSNEMTSLPDDEVAALRQAAAECAETLTERVWITVTHTFSAPHLMPDHMLKTDRERENKKTLQSLLMNAVTGAITEAKRKLQNMQLTLAKGQSAVVASRDIELPEGWWIGCGGDGPLDTTLTVLKGTADGLTQMILLHLNVQSSVLDGTGAEEGKCVSGDLAGLCSGMLEKQYPGATALVLIGAAGDMAPVERAKGLVPDGKGGYREIDLHEKGIPVAERLGNQLAQEVQNLLAQGGTLLQGEPRIMEASVIVPAKKMNRNLHELKPTHECVWEADGENEQPISLMTLDQLAIVGVKPELTYFTDQRIKTDSPFAYTLTATLVNGGAKYMATRGAYDRCMYEAINSPFGPGAAERLAHSASTMLEVAGR